MTEKPKQINLEEIMPNRVSEFNPKKNFNIFCFNGDESEHHEAYAGIKLAKNLRAILDQFLLASRSGEAITQTELFETIIAKGFSFSLQTFRRSIRELKQKSILRYEPIFIDGNKTPRANAIFFEDLNVALAASTKAELSQKKRGGFSADDRELFKKSITKRGWTEEDVSHRLPTHLAYHDDIIPSETYEIAAITKNGQNRVNKLCKKNGYKYHIEATSHEQVTTLGALGTLLALINMCIIFQAKRLASGAISEPFEEHELPARIVDILNFKGMSDSGEARKRIRSHLVQLRHTIYRLTDMVGRTDGHFKTVFDEDDYQFITRLASSADERPEMEGDAVKRNPSIYFITFDKRLEDKIKSLEQLFTLPLNICQSDPRIFLLYLNLRVRKVENEVFELRQIYKWSFYEQPYRDYKERLLSELRARFSVQANSTLKSESFNLAGYMITYKRNLDDQEIFHVVLNEREMIEQSGAKYTEGKNNAPVTKNPLKLIEHGASVQEIKQLAAFSSQNEYLRGRYLDQSTARLKFVRTLKLGPFEVHITPYDEVSELKATANLLAEQSSYDSEVCLDVVRGLVSELKPLKYGDLLVDNESFYKLRSFVSSRLSLPNLTSADVLMSVRLYRNVKIKKIINQEFEDLIPDFAHLTGE